MSPAINQAAIDIQPLWALLDAHLADQAYVAGGSLTMGDIPLGCAWWRYIHLGLDHPHYAHIERWYGALSARPSYKTHVMIEVT